MKIKSILVTGGNGLVGNALKKTKNGEYYFMFVESSVCDLRDYNQTKWYFENLKPDIVIHLAACVGGLEEKVKMFEENIIINTNVIKASHEAGVKTLIACLSTCIFPDNAVYPINESMLHDGLPHPSNEGYAYAKRLMDTHCKMYREQFGVNYFCIIPTNIYGPHDNFNLEDGHVIPSLIHTCYLAKQNNLPFEIKGSGKSLRQFIYSVDLARLILLLLEKGYNENIILSHSEEYTIGEVGELINSHFENKIVCNENFSELYRKTVDNSKLHSFNFEFTSLKDGISQTVKWFVDNYPNVRL